jgi:hypothetical protein
VRLGDELGRPVGQTEIRQRHEHVQRVTRQVVLVQMGTIRMKWLIEINEFR